MPINTRESYIEIGSDYVDGVLQNPLLLPAPIELPSSNEFLASAERNSDGTMLIEMIGRTQYVSNINFARLKNTKWWEINRWFESFGYVFYMKYFSHTEGRVKVQRFYRGNINKGNPSSTTEVLGGYTVPTHYYGCGFSMIDMGESEIDIIAEV